MFVKPLAHLVLIFSLAVTPFVTEPAQAASCSLDQNTCCCAATGDSTSEATECGCSLDSQETSTSDISIIAKFKSDTKIFVHLSNVTQAPITSPGHIFETTKYQFTYLYLSHGPPGLRAPPQDLTFTA